MARLLLIFKSIKQGSDVKYNISILDIINKKNIAFHVNKFCFVSFILYIYIYFLI